MSPPNKNLDGGSIAIFSSALQRLSTCNVSSNSIMLPQKPSRCKILKFLWLDLVGFLICLATSACVFSYMKEKKCYFPTFWNYRNYNHKEDLKKISTFEGHHMLNFMHLAKMIVNMLCVAAHKLINFYNMKKREAVCFIWGKLTSQFQSKIKFYWTNIIFIFKLNYYLFFFPTNC